MLQNVTMRYKSANQEVTMRFSSGLYVYVTHDYVMITTRARHTINFNSDVQIEKYVTGYDRCDGLDYYKDYEDKFVVRMITAAIDAYDLYAVDFMDGSRLRDHRVELSLAELGMVKEALDYAYCQVHDSNIVVFDGHAHDDTYIYDVDCVDGPSEVRTYRNYTDQECEAALEVCDSITKRIEQLIDLDGGSIEINA